MMTRAIKVLSTAALISTAIVGVASTALAQDENQVIESFVLFDTPDYLPQGCDVATQLSIHEINENGEAVFTLTNVVVGGCRITVEPEPRTYRGEVREGECGSRVFSGIRQGQLGVKELDVIDHRTRFCRDLPVAQIEAQESTRKGYVRQLFSSNRAL